jgi:hypothetical protein
MPMGMEVADVIWRRGAGLSALVWSSPEASRERAILIHGAIERSLAWGGGMLALALRGVS